MKRNTLIGLIVLVVALAAAIVVLLAVSNRDTAPAGSADTSDTTVSGLYTPPAETPATWSEFDVKTDWSESDARITLSRNTAEISGEGAKAVGGDLYIRQAGTYVLSGTFDGQICVSAGKEDKIQLVFNGVTLSCATRTPVLCERADKLVITLADGTENTVNDNGTGYIEGMATAAERYAGAIHSKDGLTINGNGKLTVKTTYRHGIVCNSNLRIVSGDIAVTAVETGLKGKESLSVRGGNITVVSGGDGLKVTDDTEDGKGYLAIEGGHITVQSDSDGIEVVKYVRIVGGKLRITSLDHAITTNGNVSIGGNATIALDAYSGSEESDAKGIKAEGDVTVEGGALYITRSFEGIESKNGAVTFSGGKTQVRSANDGINGETLISVTGGELFVSSEGDGLDSNGNIEINGGFTVVQGSASNNYAPLDVPDGFGIFVNGGSLVAYGSVGAVQYPSQGSSQAFIATSVSLKVGTVYSLCDADGNAVCTFEPLGDAQTLCMSMPELEKGKTYTLLQNVTPAGKSENGLYTDPASVGGEELLTVTAE